ncbi:S-layer homology domain-containing protein [Aeromicrobium alkaliterrae]|uniref:SLH domain-containing protein n=1 Tax=Aeromicrobium alkaliterrae TaxID=302168 RepID=A0ABN2JZQ2_9ACTN
MNHRTAPRRTVRRLAALLLAVGMLSSVVAGPSSAEIIAPDGPPFTDVPYSHTFSTEINWMLYQGISTGYVAPDGSRYFSPSAPVLREQAAAFLYRYQWGNDGDQFPGPSGFTDVADNHRFKQHIQWMAAEGITKGYANGNGTVSFHPSDPVLREQMAAFLYRFHTGPVLVAPSVSPFTDVPVTHTFYKEIYWAYSVGITKGYDNGNGTLSFRPSQPVLREQISAFLYRYDDMFNPEID